MDGSDLKKRRIEAGLSQRRLAQLADVAPHTLSRIEAGRNSPTLRTIGRIIRALEQAEAMQELDNLAAGPPPSLWSVEG